MGTYIWIHGEFTIKKSQINDAMQAIKDLNNHDELKRGGSSKGGRWFAWVDEDYDKTIDTLDDIFSKVLGFEMRILEETEEKISYSFDYNDKWGQHEVFFVAMAPYCDELVINHLCDEFNYEEQQWKIELNPVTKTVHSLQPVVMVMYPDMDESNEITVDSFRPVNYWG